jgi:hypothetical protein
MNYLDETLKLIESEEMRKHLRTSDWAFAGREGYTAIVTNAPAPLEKKIPVLDLIAEQTESNPEDENEFDPAKMATAARTALDERYNNNPPGTVFMVNRYFCHEHYEGENTLFTTYDAAFRFIKETEETDGEEYSECIWYQIDKWIPAEDGKMEEAFGWTLNAADEIWYFDNRLDYNPAEEGFYCIIGDNYILTTLTVPFQPGDIILADCRPFAEERRVLILEILNDGGDCCGVQCLFTLPDGRLDTGAFKHNSFLRCPEETRLNVLYRATRWHGELPEDEAALGVIGAAVKARPELGREIQEYIRECRGKEERRAQGVAWEWVKSYFKL